MPIDYLGEFPIPADALPAKLRALMTPVGPDPDVQVAVAERYDADHHGPNREYAHFVTAIVPEAEIGDLGLLREALTGLVETSVPVIEEKGGLGDRQPSISGHDYVVAAWGDHSWFAFNLAEAVWMTLGLSPRCLGNDSQRLIYDDLTLPDFGIAEGEVTSEHYWTSKRDVLWRMRNDYLRRYLWMRGGWGVRAFYYEAAVPDLPVFRDLMGGQAQAKIGDRKWCEVELRPRGDGLLLQVTACVAVLSPERCPEPSAEGLIWPGIDGPMTSARADALVGGDEVLLDDRFLERYEHNAAYDTTPMWIWDRWHCSPSYVGQWGFSECVRVGRNLIRVPIRELYKPKPAREILHAHHYALRPEQVAHLDLAAEPITGKVARLVKELLALADGLAWLNEAVAGPPLAADEVFGLSARALHDNGWMAHPALERLAQVAPLDMTQQAFLARCKGIHELWQKLPNGLVRRLLLAAGHTQAQTKDLGSLKLLQGLLNALQALNANQETIAAFSTAATPDGLTRRNPALASLFLTNELRIADAHELDGKVKGALEALGLDLADLNTGYGRALDLVFDQVIEVFATFSRDLEALRDR